MTTIIMTLTRFKIQKVTKFVTTVNSMNSSITLKHLLFVLLINNLILFVAVT